MNAYFQLTARETEAKSFHPRLQNLAKASEELEDTPGSQPCIRSIPRETQEGCFYPCDKATSNH